MDSTRDTAYFFNTNTTQVIDSNAGTIRTAIASPGQELRIAINPFADRLFVGMTTALYVIDTSQNTVVVTINLTGDQLESVEVNPVTGHYYFGRNINGVFHITIYTGANNTLITNLTSTARPEITGAADMKADPLNNKIYVGTEKGSTTSLYAIIDGNTNTVGAHSLAIDLGTGVVAAGGFSYPDLWFPTSDVAGRALTSPRQVTSRSQRLRFCRPTVITSWIPGKEPGRLLPGSRRTAE